MQEELIRSNEIEKPQPEEATSEREIAGQRTEQASPRNSRNQNSMNPSPTNSRAEAARVNVGQIASAQAAAVAASEDAQRSQVADEETKERLTGDEKRLSANEAAAQDAEHDEDNLTDSGYAEEEEDDLNQKVAEISPKGRFKRFYEELGRGAYKIVYKGVDHETGLEIAWNSISLSKLPQSDRVRIKKEIDLVKSLRHDNIIHFITGWQNKEKNEVVFITEITTGTLSRYIKKNKITRLKVIKGWCQSILSGLVYLHEQELPIIHRDLKCDNIFINSNSGEIRIGDLGLSTPMNNSYTSSVLGTPEFMAPELYEEHYDVKIDVYAFGMCMLEMITQEKPYSECFSPAQIYKKVTAGIPPVALSRIKDQEVYNFIYQCLQPDKTLRPTARELLESEFIVNQEDEKSKNAVPLGPPTRRAINPSKRRSLLDAVKSAIPEVEEEGSDHEEVKVAQVHDPASTNEAQASAKSQSHVQQRDDPNQTLPSSKIQAAIREMNAEEEQQEESQGADFSQVPETNKKMSKTALLQSQSSARNNEHFDSNDPSPFVNVQGDQSVPSAPKPVAEVSQAMIYNDRAELQSQPDVAFEGHQESMVHVKAENFEGDGRNKAQDTRPGIEVDDCEGQRGSDESGARAKVTSPPSQPLTVGTVRLRQSEVGRDSQLHKSFSEERPQVADDSNLKASTLAAVDKQNQSPQSSLLERNRVLIGMTRVSNPQQQSFKEQQELTNANWTCQLLSVQQTNSDGNHSQSSGMTIRKLTDVGNPDCTFSDPRFVSGNTIEDQVLGLSSRGDQMPHPFATLGAQDSIEQSISHRNRVDTSDACFGGSGSDKDDQDKRCYTQQYSDDDGIDEEDADVYSDDDDERQNEMMNQSLQFLNELDRTKHEHLRDPNHDFDPSNRQKYPKDQRLWSQQQQQESGASNPPLSKSKGNILDDLKQSLQHEDEMERNSHTWNHPSQIQAVPVPQMQKRHSVKQHPTLSNTAAVVGSSSKIKHQSAKTHSRSSQIKNAENLPVPVSTTQTTQQPAQPQSIQANAPAQQTVRQPVVHDQKHKNTVLAARKFEEDDMDRCAYVPMRNIVGAPLSSEQVGAHAMNQKAVSAQVPKAVASKQVHNHTQSAQHQHPSELSQKRIDQSPAEQVQFVLPVASVDRRASIQKKPSNPKSIVTNNRKGHVEEEQTPVRGDEEDDCELFDEQHTSSESCDTDSDDADDFVMTGQSSTTVGSHRPSQKLHKAATLGHQSQRHLLPASAKLLNAQKSSEHRPSGASAAVGTNQKETASQHQTLVKSGKVTSKATSKTLKSACSTTFVSPKEPQRNQASIVPQGTGESWSVVASSRKDAFVPGEAHNNGKETQKAQEVVNKPWKRANNKPSASAVSAASTQPVKTPQQAAQPSATRHNQHSSHQRQNQARSRSNLGQNRSDSANRMPQHQQSSKPSRKTEHLPVHGAVLQQKQMMTLSASDNEAAILQQTADNSITANWVRKQKHIINITIQYPESDGRKREAHFDFNIIQDTASGVANEMVSELSVNPSFTNQIKHEIEVSVRQYQVLQEPSKQKAEEKEKVLRHSFKKLQNHIETFLAEMRQSGLSTNKEICHMFENLYPTNTYCEDSNHKTGTCALDGLSKISKTLKNANNQIPKQPRAFIQDEPQPLTLRDQQATCHSVAIKSGKQANQRLSHAQSIEINQPQISQCNSKQSQLDSALLKHSD